MRRIIAAMALVGAASPLNAHEYWFEAPSHQIETGDGIEVGIFVGSDLVGQQMPYFPQAFRSIFSTSIGRVACLRSDFPKLIPARQKP